MKKIKGFLLFLMVILSIYLSTQVWLELPDFLSFNKNKSTEDVDNQQDIDKMFWELVRPSRYLVKDDMSLKEIYVEDEAALWQSAIKSLETALKNLSQIQSNLIVGEFFPDE